MNPNPATSEAAINTNCIADHQSLQLNECELSAIMKTLHSYGMCVHTQAHTYTDTHTPTPVCVCSVFVCLCLLPVWAVDVSSWGQVDTATISQIQLGSGQLCEAAQQDSDELLLQDSLQPNAGPLWLHWASDACNHPTLCHCWQTDPKEIIADYVLTLRPLIADFAGGQRGGQHVRSYFLLWLNFDKLCRVCLCGLCADVGVLVLCKVVQSLLNGFHDIQRLGSHTVLYRIKRHHYTCILYHVKLSCRLRNKTGSDQFTEQPLTFDDFSSQV